MLRLGPGDEFEPPVMVLGDCRAALDPVAAIDVMDAERVMHRGMMDVPADHAIDIMTLRLRGERPLVIADKIDGIFDLELCPFRQRPIAQAEPAAERR
jgi:hypothetical protein